MSSERLTIASVGWGAWPRSAEEAGFDFVSVSDHYHPWVGAQGHSPFVWSVLGAIATVTDEIGVGVGVSCPLVRMHPAVTAHAVATSACLLGDRFTWGAPSGRRRNRAHLDPADSVLGSRSRGRGAAGRRTVAKNEIAPALA